MSTPRPIASSMIRALSPGAALARARVGLRGDTTLGVLLERLQQVHGGRAPFAQEAGGQPVSFAQAAALVDGWAGGLVDGGLAPHEPVVLHLPNGLDLLLACFAVCRAGGVAVPVNPQLRPEELEHVITDAGASRIVRHREDLDRGARPLGRSAPAAPGDTAALFYTSGTTGRPKGVVLSHRGLLGGTTRAALLPLAARRDEAVVALPVAHIFGFTALVGLACAGVPAYVVPRFRAEAVLDALEQRRSSVFIGVPAMYRLMEEAGAAERDLTSVRLFVSGADVMPDDLARTFQRMGASATLPVFGPVGRALFAEGYGMVELGGGVAAKVRAPGLDRLLPGDALGLPLPGWRFRVIGEDGRPVGPDGVGELHVRGPGVLKGYHGDEAATDAVLTPDGWVRTGDLAQPGPLGSVRFAGRAKDVVKRGGYSVYATEVQSALERHPAVAEAAVLGLPDPKLGEVPVAAVRLAPDATLAPADLVAWAHEHLAPYKVPVEVVVVDDLPRTGTGKVQKARLRDAFTPRS